MGGFYEISVKVPLKPGADVADILREIAGYCGDGIELLEDEDAVVISGGNHMSYDSVSELDDLIRGLGDFAREGAMASFDCDGERGEYYVGPPDQEGSTLSAHALGEIRGRLSDLRDRELRELVDLCEAQICVLRQRGETV
jgi:hypothetical protein